MRQSPYAYSVIAGELYTPEWYCFDLGWWKFVPNPKCCDGCANKHWDMFLTLWLAVGEAGPNPYRKGKL